MNRIVACFAFVLLIPTGGCTFDLTEVPIETRDGGVVVLIETTRGSDTRVSIQFDAGTTDDGAERTLGHDSVLVDGVAYPPTHRLDERRLFEVLVPESAASIHIVLPSIRGMAEIPAFIAVPLRIAVPDTLSDNAAGVLEIPILGTDAGNVADQSSWHATLSVAGTPAPQLSVAGTHPIPPVLRIPTIHLSAEVQEGHVEVWAASRQVLLPESGIEIILQRMMHVAVPFRIMD